MRNYLLVSISILLISCNSKSDEELVHDCFEYYKEAVHDGATETAAYYVHQNTFDYYDQMLDHIKQTDSIGLMELPINDQLLIVTVRNNFSKPEIEEFNGKSLFKTFITSEYMDTESIISQEVGTVSVNGDKAEGTILLMGEETPWGYTFYRVEEEWKVDISSMNFLAEEVVNDMIAEEGISSCQYIIESIEFKTGAPIDSTVWNP